MKKLVQRSILFGLVCGLLTAFSFSQAAAPKSEPAAPGYLGLEYQVSIPTDPQADRYRPQAAYNVIHKEYLVVWHNTYDNGQRYIYGRRLDQYGAPIGGVFTLANQVDDSVHPFVVYNQTNDQYFVVWMFDASGNNTKYEIWGSILPWNASGAAAGFRIVAVGSENITMWRPSAAWNSTYNYYTVIWDEYLGGNPPVTPTRIGFQVVDQDGAIGWGTSLTITGQPSESDIVYNPESDLFMAVWARMADYDTQPAGIYRMVFDPVAMSFGSETATATQFANERNPAVAVNSLDRFMIAFQNAESTGQVVRMYDCDADGIGCDYVAGFYGTQFNLSLADIASSGTAGGWLLGMDRTATSSGEQTIQTVFKPWDNFTLPAEQWGFIYQPGWTRRTMALAEGRGNVLMVYEGIANTLGARQHIYARMFWPAVVFLPMVIR